MCVTRESVEIIQKEMHRHTQVIIHRTRDKDPKDAFKPDLNIIPKLIQQVWDLPIQPFLNTFLTIIYIIKKI